MQPPPVRCDGTMRELREGPVRMAGNRWLGVATCCRCRRGCSDNLPADFGTGSPGCWFACQSVLAIPLAIV